MNRHSVYSNNNNKRRQQTTTTTTEKKVKDKTKNYFYTIIFKETYYDDICG